MLAALACLTAVAWAWLLLGRGRFWHILLPRPTMPQPATWPSVVVVVPARNEASMLPQTLPALLAQDYPGDWKVILVDDNSTDDTTIVTRRYAAAQSDGRLRLVQAPALPTGWSGKVHAMYCGVQAADTPDYFLFTDADIRHQPASLRYLVTRAETEKLDLHSLMVKLHCHSFWEKLLMPAFVYFFQMLYPFAWSNDPARRTAAAAGGAMLVRRTALEEAGGLETIKGALIDDCSLAKALKWRGARKRGAPTLLTLVDHDVVSLRVYDSLGEIWRMISRSAYTQLNYSPLLLAGTVLGMGLLFIAPFALCMPDTILVLAGWLVLVAMLYSYLPMVEFYRLNPFWAATLPLAALIYIGATLDSARLDWMGRGGRWKNRTQAATP